MKFHTIDKSGHRQEVSPLEYLKAPMCRRHKFMEALAEIRQEREARRCIKLHEELEKTAEMGLKFKK